MFVGGVFTSLNHACGWSVHWNEPMFVGGVFTGVSPCLWMKCSLE